MFVFSWIYEILSVKCLHEWNLKDAVRPLGWDNWLCVNQRDGWNIIQRGCDDQDLASLPHCTTSPTRFLKISFLKSADRARLTLLLQASSNMLNLQLRPQGAPRPDLRALAKPGEEVWLSFSTKSLLELSWSFSTFRDLHPSVSGSTHEMSQRDLEEKVSSRFCDVDKWFIQQEWWTIYFSTEGNRAP